MGYAFEEGQGAEVEATVDEVWQAIATGPGIDSWFMGHTEVADGVVRTAFGQYAQQAPITVEEPGSRLRYGTTPAPDGRFIAYDFLIEGRAGGSTSLRLVASGFLPGDDWADEFDAMARGGALYFASLVEYVNRFAGRAGTPVTAFGPPVPDWDLAWARLGTELGLDRPARTGDRVRLAVDGGRVLDGTVYFANEDTVGISTTDALYRFLRGFRGPMVAMHSLFEPDVDGLRAGQLWQDWLGRVLG